ncbi:hypothetical protein [Pararhizobium antarcticum]|uniref:Uncharacterized protein n=1 Tax=Pararhizobium antarcticum TaxID=1798805 RepID=A0A657LWD9_9HYPH|nr:hypothetical protein [Pararhizobium antarcticum]OJF91053.1 hypothetical protein AX761_06220 [Rhizobium sp. 58]OJF99982.1 hypothetical protein AX760_11395 [Pararhizobium antarcticum]
MAFDPIKAFTHYNEAECSVQFWVADAPASVFASLEEAVAFARDNGAGWKDVEITVHMPREDIVYATGKVRTLIEALRKQPR